MTGGCKFVLVLSFAIVVLCSTTTFGQAIDCTSFQRMINTTYNFRPAKLSEAQKTAKSKEMDRVWDAVKRDPDNLVPCLRSALAESGADPFFLFDGSNLLLSLDPSGSTKQTLIRSYARVDLADVDPRVWVGRLALLAFEGFDIAEAADKWLRFPNATYYLPQHGAYKVTMDNGAMFLYGSMDETYATPALVKIVFDKSHPGRETALWALMNQATPEALQALKQVDPKQFSQLAQGSLNALTIRPTLIEARRPPKNTRAEFIHAFERLIKGDPEPFFTLTSRTPDGEKDLVAVVTPEDIPLVRKVRRRLISTGNPHMMGYYNDFSLILMTLVWKPPANQ